MKTLKKLTFEELSNAHRTATAEYGRKLDSWGRANVGTVLADAETTALRAICNTLYAEICRRGDM